MVKFLIESFGRSIRKVCELIDISRCAYRYELKAKNDMPIRERMRHWAEKKKRWGCPMLHAVLRREGLVKNHKRTERIYREEGLSLRRKKRKKMASFKRTQPQEATQPNEIWSMDFIEDKLWSGRRIRCLTLVDTFTRECPVIEVDTSIGGERLTRVLDRIVAMRGLPKLITIDNGPEFISKAVDAWAYRNGVGLDFITPGKPVENCYIESFHDKFRDECLNLHYFTALKEAQDIIEDWRGDYNEVRPHSSLDYLTPNEFALKHQESLTTAAPKADLNTEKLYFPMVLKQG